MSIQRKTDPESKAFWRRVDEAASVVEKYVERKGEHSRDRELRESRDATRARDSTSSTSS